MQHFRVSASLPALVDTAVNLTDGVFHGINWSGKRIHEDDFEAVLQRASRVGVAQMIITGTDLTQSEQAIALCRQRKEVCAGQLLCTVGVHPARCSHVFERMPPPRETQKVTKEEEQEEGKEARVSRGECVTSSTEQKERTETTHAPDAATGEEHVHLDADHVQRQLQRLVQLVQRHRDVVVAVGEIGLDDAELQYSSQAVQEHCLVEQLRALAPLRLPFIFHSRDCGMRFVEVLRAHTQPFPDSAELSDSVHGTASVLDGSSASVATSASAAPAVTVGVGELDTSAAPPLRIAAPCERRSPASMRMIAGVPLRGVVHSFNGSREEQEALLEMGLCLSLNASAFRQPALAEQVMHIPLHRLLFESDAPWCDVRRQDYGFAHVTTSFPTHKANKFVLGDCVERRNEPCHVVQVVEEYVGTARAHGCEWCATMTHAEAVMALRAMVHANSCALFGAHHILPLAGTSNSWKGAGHRTA